MYKMAYFDKEPSGSNESEDEKKRKDEGDSQEKKVLLVRRIGELLEKEIRLICVTFKLTLRLTSTGTGDPVLYMYIASLISFSICMNPSWKYGLDKREI